MPGSCSSGSRPVKGPSYLRMNTWSGSNCPTVWEPLAGLEQRASTSEKKSERPAIQATAGTVKTAFVKDSQQYVQFLINEVLKRVGLTSNIAKGLTAFDPFILFKRPMDVALKHFDMLYNTFAFRSWVPSANESLCRDQYMQLLDHLRTSYGPNFDLTSTWLVLNSCTTERTCSTYSSCAVCVQPL